MLFSLSSVLRNKVSTNLGAIQFATEVKPFLFAPSSDEPYEESLVVENDKPMGSKTEKAETVAKTGEAAKPKKSAPRKTAAARKPRTHLKK